MNIIMIDKINDSEITTNGKESKQRRFSQAYNHSLLSLFVLVFAK